MRLLIAAGGTGGHIYPALAVARSLRDRHADAPELRWLGGHRGLEATLVPAAGIPLRRLAAALAADRPRPTSTPSSTRSGSALSVPQATAILAARAAGGDLHDRRLRRGARSCWPPRRCGIPVVLWEGNVIPGRAVRATARLADALAVSFEADRAGRSRGRPAARAT